jgi:hypothetical protein
MLEQIGIGNKFLNRTPIAQQLREEIEEWHCTAKENSHQIKEATYRIGKNLCQLYI